MRIIKLIVLMINLPKILALGRTSVRGLDFTEDHNEESYTRKRLKDKRRLIEYSSGKTAAPGISPSMPISPSLPITPSLPVATTIPPHTISSPVSPAPTMAPLQYSMKRQHSKSSKSGKHRKSHSTKKSTSKKSKSKVKSKGKSKGKHGSGYEDDDEVNIYPPDLKDRCLSSISKSIHDNFSDVIPINPSRCCNFEGPVAVYITHATPDPETASGLELFWDTIYTQIMLTSDPEDICFVFTGVQPVDSADLSQLLIDVQIYVSEIPHVMAMMVTDPTESVDLINTIRSLSDNPENPSIGVFNAGYNNIIIESVVSGKGRLPFVGYLNDEDFGKQAAMISLNLLKETDAQPLCFNARIGTIEFIGARCEAYYDEITDKLIDPVEGLPCSDVDEVYDAITTNKANAVYAEVQCCSIVAEAVERARSVNSSTSTIIVGCQDYDTTGGRIDFVTTQPITLQGYSAATWANFPVIQSMMGKNGRYEQYFPSLQSLVNTAIFNVII